LPVRWGEINVADRLRPRSGRSYDPIIYTALAFRVRPRQAGSFGNQSWLDLGVERACIRQILVKDSEFAEAGEMVGSSGIPEGRPCGVVDALSGHCRHSGRKVIRGHFGDYVGGVREALAGGRRFGSRNLAVTRGQLGCRIQPSEGIADEPQSVASSVGWRFKQVSFAQQLEQANPVLKPSMLNIILADFPRRACRSPRSSPAVLKSRAGLEVEDLASLNAICPSMGRAPVPSSGSRIEICFSFDVFFDRAFQGPLFSLRIVALAYAHGFCQRFGYVRGRSPLKAAGRFAPQWLRALFQQFCDKSVTALRLFPCRLLLA